MIAVGVGLTAGLLQLSCISHQAYRQWTSAQATRCSRIKFSFDELLYGRCAMLVVYPSAQERQRYLPVFSDEFIDVLYEKLLFEESTSDFLSLVISQFAGNAGQLVYRTLEIPHPARRAATEAGGKEDKSLSLESQNVDMEAASPFFDGMYKIDPAAQRGLTLDINRPYLPIHSMERDTYLRSPLYQYVLKPSGLSDLMSLRFPYRDGALALMIYKSGDGRFSENEVEAASLLYPHLKRAFALHDRLFIEDSVVARAARTYQYTDREHDIVVHLANGLPYREIEEILGITRNTMKWHMKNLFDKTSVSSLSEFLVRVFNS